MTYPLLDHCNRRNAAELARVVNLSAAELVRVESLEWAPPTEEVLAKWMWGSRKCGTLGRGDLIYCGEAYGADADDESINCKLSAAGYNVCRPFDETYHEHVRNMRPLLSDLADFSLKEFAKSTTHHTPPNHGHGAPCGCAFTVDFWQLSLAEDIRLDGRDQIKATLLVPPGQEREVVCVSGFGRKKSGTRISVRPLDCPHCSGTGRLICDDERAGRVSPSHAAGGYAEYMRKNAPSDGIMMLDESAQALTPEALLQGIDRFGFPWVLAALDERARTPHAISSTRGFDWLGSEQPDDDQTE